MEMEKFIQDKTRASAFRSKAKWLLEGERSSKYYFSLEKANYNKKLMSELRLQDGSTSRDLKIIMNEQTKFYKRLYKSDPDIKFTLVNDTPNSLSEDQRIELDRDISLDELSVALHTLPGNKTPGLDGLTPELYKKFWKKLGPLYLHSLQYCLREGKLNRTARQGLIQLIPKKDKDPLLLTNWRSLTLLNTDYKIFSKALALRMKRVLPDIIDADQTGFMSGRDICVNIRKIIDVIEYTRDTDVPCAIMSVDFEKCFDKLENSAIMGALRFFNFGDNFINYSMLLFTSFSAHVQNNGYLSNMIPITRSCHQGCPASPYYFLCCAQIFHQLIKNHPDIKGIKIHDIEVLLSQFADDTDLFLAYDNNTFKAVEKVFNIIHTNMGLSVNYDKTTVYRIGSIRNTNARLYTTKPLAWTNEPINVLGVMVGHDTNDLFQSNFANILNKTETILNLWHNRNATLSGKILIINTLVASLFVYKMRVLPAIPTAFVTQFYKIVHKFLWSGRRAKICSSALSLPRRCGGLKLVDLAARHKALKISWIKHITEIQFFNEIFYHGLSFSIGDQIWQCNFKAEHVNSICLWPPHSFWFQMLQAWAEFNFSMPEDVDEILNQCLWLNSLLLIDNKPFLFIRAYQAGMTVVKDIVDERGNFYTYDRIKTIFGDCITWLEYHQIQLAFHPQWKRELRLSPREQCYVLTNFELLKEKDNWSRFVYDNLVTDDSNDTVEKKCDRWNRYLNSHITYSRFLKAFEDIIKCTISTKLRDFQYRLLHCNIFLNDILYKWKKVEHNRCYYCNAAPETLIHFFIACPKTDKLWMDLKHFIEQNDNTGIRDLVSFTPVNIILNSVHPKPSHVVNMLVLITKQLIFRNRCLQRSINFAQIEHEIELMYKLEENIANQTHKLRKHYEKWGCIKEVPDIDLLEFEEQFNSV